MTSAALERATYRVSDQDLEYMVLDRSDLPEDFQSYQQVRVGVLDNENMAAHGFAGSTAARFSQAGRITGYMREFGPTSEMNVFDGFNFVGSTVAHLFDKPESVTSWMTDIFPKGLRKQRG